jgi:hypothetical protein
MKRQGEDRSKEGGNFGAFNLKWWCGTFNLRWWCGANLKQKIRVG